MNADRLGSASVPWQRIRTLATSPDTVTEVISETSDVLSYGQFGGEAKTMTILAFLSSVRRATVVSMTRPQSRQALFSVLRTSSAGSRPARIMIHLSLLPPVSHCTLRGRILLWKKKGQRRTDTAVDAGRSSEDRLSPIVVSVPLRPRVSPYPHAFVSSRRRWLPRCLFHLPRHCIGMAGLCHYRHAQVSSSISWA